MPISFETSEIPGGCVVCLSDPVSYTDYATSMARLLEIRAEEDFCAILIDASGSHKPQKASMARTLWDDVAAGFNDLPVGYVVPKDFDEKRKESVLELLSTWDVEITFFDQLEDGLAWMAKTCDSAAA